MSAFAQLAQKLAGQGVQNPGGLAYSIGARKFGKKRMALAAKEGKPAAKVRPQ